MGISAGFLNKPDTFPDRFGYDENKDEYFVEISKERSNDRLTAFSDKNSEEFRWYILKWLAEGWGQYCELRNRDELGQKWEKAADKPVDGGGEYVVQIRLLMTQEKNPGRLPLRHWQRSMI